MSTTVCQGLQPCLEAHVLETAMLRLKLAAPKSIEFGMEIIEKFPYEDTTIKSDFGCRSFLQSLSNLSNSPTEEKAKDTPYVHPLVKLSASSRLSEKSLELCTENLGSETGTDIIESSIFSSSSLYSNTENSPTREEKKPRQPMESRKENSLNFPPPLTTISGANALQIRPHREGGRLIIKAVEAPPTHSYFQAERSNGRLRLCFLKDDALEAPPQNTLTCQTAASNFYLKVTSQGNEVRSEEHDFVEVENGIGQEGEEERKGEEEDEKYEHEDEEESEGYVSNDMDGTRLEVDAEIGLEKFQRPSRCKEGGCGNKGLRNWEPFWVAT